jgi:serine/threonine protein phosphatase PrpC
VTIYESIDSSGGTHVGKVRKQNEDNLIARPEIGLWAVADGMGGLDAGNVASAIVIEHLEQMPIPDAAATLLRDCSERMRAANREIRSVARERDVSMMGTTVAILLASGPYYACLWSGDSRIYRVRATQIAQLTHDHSEAQEMLDQGLLTPDDARNWPRKNIITRAIGVFPDVELDIVHGEIETGDVFVLCSDGLTNHLEDTEIAVHASTGSAQDICGRLIQTTLDRGAQDNVTVIVVRFELGERTIFAPAHAKSNGQGPS